MTQEHMSLEGWLERLRMMARSSVVELHPTEVADLVVAIDELRARPAPPCVRWHLVPCETLGDELFTENGEPRFNVVRGHEAPFEHHGHGSFTHRQACRLVRTLNSTTTPESP